MRIALVGATGAVGSELCLALGAADIGLDDLRLLGSEGSAGELYEFKGDSISIEGFSEDSFEGVDIAVFAVQQPISSAFIPAALKAGATVIDLSGWSARSMSAPVIACGVNDEVLSPDVQLIAAAGAVSSQAAVPLAVLDRAAGLRSAVIAGYLSVSGAGKHALDELWAQTLAVVNQRETEQEIFLNQIAFNCIPQVGSLHDSGDTDEELRVISELGELLGRSSSSFSATLVWVPVFHCHGLLLDVVLAKELRREELIDRLADCPTVIVHQKEGDLPLHRDVVGSAEIHVGRVRVRSGGCSMWVVGDNLTYTSVVNVVGIIKRIISFRG